MEKEIEHETEAWGSTGIMAGPYMNFLHFANNTSGRVTHARPTKAKYLLVLEEDWIRPQFPQFFAVSRQSRGTYFEPYLFVPTETLWQIYCCHSPLVHGIGVFSNDALYHPVSGQSPRHSVLYLWSLSMSLV